MKKTKLALLHSVIALLLCCSMLIGTTFAWFTDSVTSGVNHIIAGNLDVELEYLDENDKWQPVREGTNVFAEGTLWEPGHTEVVYLKVSNLGTLALKYNLGVNIVSETGSINKDGDPFLLSDHIEFGVVQDVSSRFGSREEARKAVTESKLISEGYSKSGSIAKDGAAQYVALVVYMPEETDNVANYMSGENPPKIDLGINLVATQMTAEGDSFGSDYDAGAAFPKQDINVSVGQSVGSKIENSKLTEQVTVGNVDNDIYAVVPDGVQMADGATSLQLSVSAKEESEAIITLDDGEVALPLDIHMEGVSENNTTPMLVTLKGLLRKGLNSTSVAMYHVENGVTVAMTLVALSDLDAHNEFSYDPATGDVTLCVANFSEYDVVVNNYNYWTNEAEDYSWYTGKNAGVYSIANADQLAAFGRIVDGTAEGFDSYDFDGQIVKLISDINLEGYDSNDNRVSFNPIGCGYADSTINSNGVTGRVFSGTFDGQNYTISGLYQNGWDLGLSYCNLGGGLFASVADATIQNLTISGAEIAMECVEMGVVAGLVQGSCTFDNIKIYDSKIANYQKATGGLIGEVSGEGTTTIQNVVIGSNVVVGSLWGDFDAPVGGVIGARWDNLGKDPQIEMNNVTVAARLDVYNDVTSAYQWYAYRRAGMLIGNTETAAATDGRTVATAEFLSCTNVVVKYGDWVNYHYCEFTNQDDAWCNNYPWVRVEAGENCSAYSNPRYGQPVVGGVTIDSENHTCTGEHNLELTFNQLYGGGQGVYGESTHTNVDVQHCYYTIHFVDNNQELYTIDVTTGDKYEINYVPDTIANFKGWQDAYANSIDSIRAGNLNDITLYPKREGEYVIRFLKQDGTVVDWQIITAVDEIAAPDVPSAGDGFDGVWMTKNANDEWIDLATWKAATGTTPTDDAIFYAYYTYTDGVILEPILDSDGVLIAYRVTGRKNNEADVDPVIPDYVNGIPVTEISDNAFAGFSDLRDIYVPNTIEKIEIDAFTKYDTGWGAEYPMIQIIFDGTRAEWDALDKAEGWDRNIGTGSNIVFLREETVGYSSLEGTIILGYKANTSWKWIEGSYPDWFMERHSELAESK